MPSTERVFVIVRRAADGLAIVVIGLAVSAVILGRLVPALGHPVYVVAGASMTPAIEMGSAIVLEAVAPTDLAPGDVVSLRSGPQRAVFTHRVIRVAERAGEVWVETRGDANPAPDPSLTPASAVIGRVAVTIPLAGYLIALLSVPAGVVFAISLGLLFLALGWWLDDRRAEHRRAGAVLVVTATGARRPVRSSARVRRSAGVRRA
jgi:signal peptidase